MFARIETTVIIFMSILLEAFPYLLLGTLLSSLIQEFVPSSFFAKIIPKNKFLGSIVGCLMGFFLPCCDCAVIPVARGLMKKGVSQNAATSFMLASPIINPIVILATYSAFSQVNMKMIILRIGLGALVAILTGVLVSLFTKGKSFNDEKSTDVNSHGDDCGCGHDHGSVDNDTCDCGHDHGHAHDDGCECGHDHDDYGDDCGCDHDHSTTNLGFGSRIVSVFRHTVVEFFDIGRYLIVGAIAAALVQIFVPFSVMSALSTQPIISVLLMGFFAYLLSLCSTSDAFVARSFVGIMSNSSILAFLLISPMLSVKSTIVLLGNFNKKYAWLVNVICFILVVIACLIIGPMVF